MIKIVTALQNEEVNYELKKVKEFYIEYDDIQYEEGLIEILKKNKDIEYIIFNKKILEKNDLENFIKLILNINKNMKIIFLYNNKDEIKELNNDIEQAIKLIKVNYDLDSNDKIAKVIESKICSKEYSGENDYLEENERMKVEINYLKNIIEKNRINLKEINNIKDREKNLGKVISITGAKNSGKTIITAIMSKMISRSNKVLIIDIDFENKDMKLLFDIESYNIKKDKNIVKKVNKNLDIICDMNVALENIKNIEDNLNKLFIKLKEKYDYIFIDLSEKSDKYIWDCLLSISNYVFLLIEGNIINIRKSKIVYERILKINSNINIILNKKTKYSIDKILINKIFNNNLFRNNKI